MSDTCRSCRAPIRWAVTTAGRRMPLDLEPVPDGNVVIEGEKDGVPVVRVLHRDEQPALFEADQPERFTSHFASCPDADRHRRPR